MNKQRTPAHTPVWRHALTDAALTGDPVADREQYLLSLRPGRRTLEWML